MKTSLKGGSSPPATSSPWHEKERASGRWQWGKGKDSISKGQLQWCYSTPRTTASGPVIQVIVDTWWKVSLGNASRTSALPGDPCVGKKPALSPLLLLWKSITCISCSALRSSNPSESGMWPRLLPALGNSLWVTVKMLLHSSALPQVVFNRVSSLLSACPSQEK